MSTQRWFRATALVLTLALVGCGERGGPSGGGSVALRIAPKAAKVEASLASLVPSDAVALVYVRSPRDLESKLRSLITKFDPETAESIDIGAIVGSMMMDQGEHLDMGKPMAIALRLPAEGADAQDLLGGRGMAMIFGMKDAAAAKAALEKAVEDRFAEVPEEFRPKPEEKPTVTIAGDYLTLTQGPAGKLGGNRLTATAPDFDIGIRVDLETLVARYRKEIDDGLAKMEQGMAEGADAMPPGLASMGGMLKGLAAGLRDFVDSAESLDLGLSMESGEVELALGFIAKPGSKLDRPAHDHAGLSAMAALLPEGMPINALVSMDMGGLMKWFRPLMEAGMESMTEEQKASLQRYLDEATEMTKLLGPNVALAMSLGEDGMQLVEIAEVKDGATYVQRTDALVSGDALAGIPGFSAAKAGTSTVAGVQVHSYTLTMDMKAMLAAQGQDLPEEAVGMVEGMMQRFFGGEAMTFHMATLEGKLLFTMGKQAHLETLIQTVRSGGGTAPAALKKGLDRAGTSPVFLLQMDVRELARSVTGIMSQIMDQPVPAVPAGKPVPVLIWGKHDARVYGGGLRVDVHGIVDMVKAMSDESDDGGDDDDK